MASASLRLNRIIRIQSRVKTRDAYGSEIEAWVDVAEVWANVNQTGTSEKFNNDAKRMVALRNATMRIRWRDDVAETSRVIYAMMWPKLTPRSRPSRTPRRRGLRRAGLGHRRDCKAGPTSGA